MVLRMDDLYLGGEPCKSTHIDKIESPSIGDYVMVSIRSGDIEGVEVRGGAELRFTGKILGVSQNKVELIVMGLGTPRRVALPKSRLINVRW